MMAGDLVRFRPPYYIVAADDATTPQDSGDWCIGLLVEYQKWEKIATILYDNELLRIPARDVQKYGRRYIESA